MNAANWINQTSFNGPRNKAETRFDAQESTWDACWDSWDGEQGRWRHWARKGSQIVETNEIGVAL